MIVTQSDSTKRSHPLLMRKNSDNADCKEICTHKEMSFELEVITYFFCLEVIEPY